MVWIQFVLCTSMLLVSAGMLSRYGDVLSEKTGLGRTWVGAVLLAGATSLPELVSGSSAVVLLDAPNLAVGSIFGSCLLNLVLIAFMDLLFQPGRILLYVNEGHVLSGGLGIIMTGTASASILLGPAYNPGLAGVGLTSLLLLGLYVVGVRVIFKFEKRRQVEHQAERAEKLLYANISSFRAYMLFVCSALAVMGLGLWLASITDGIAATTGLSRSFAGTIFLAFSTSLPEVIVCMAAVRLGAIDLAMGNVLGSNLFNIAILAVLDIVGRGNLWSALPAVHAVAGLMVMVITGVVIVSLVYRASPKTPSRFGWDGTAILMLYLAAVVLLFLLGGRTAG